MGTVPGRWVRSCRGARLPTRGHQEPGKKAAIRRHHSFVEAGEKEDAIHRLRMIAARPDAPTGPQIEDYLRASGATDAKGIERAAKWYVEILEGRRHRDHRGRDDLIDRSRPARLD